MRVARVCVGGGAPGTRVCAYAQLRVTPADHARQVTRQVTRDVRPSQAERSPAKPAGRTPEASASHPPVIRQPAGRVTPRPTCRRVATPRLGGEDSHRVTPSARLRDTWERGGEEGRKNGVEKNRLTA